ncbi:hypothetical protein [Salipiger sp.]|uniref:hypothetical protein n=1 Tax=Salipiger sp. TaxID=2078585 RepID=UPI003A97B43B
MTTSPRAYEEVTLVQGATALRLRPTLRAACALERLHGGFPALLRKLEQTDTTTVRAIIAATATEDRAANDFLRRAAKLPLSVMVRWQPVLFVVVAALLPTPANESPAASDPDTATPWADLFQELFGLATGWLGWSPADAWNATPQEIITAFDKHLNKLRIIHGGAEKDPEKRATTSGMDEEQRRANVAAGLDPDFDREGLAPLKAKIAGGYA